MAAKGEIIAPGSGESLDFRINRVDMATFRVLSGDTNPLHDDPGFARQCGFEDVVVHGSLIVAQVSKLLGTGMPGPGCIWRSVTLRFRNPLYPDVPARLNATVVYTNQAFGLLRLKLRVKAAGVVIADGEAEAQLARRHSNARVAHAVQ